MTKVKSKQPTLSIKDIRAAVKVLEKMRARSRCPWCGGGRHNTYEEGLKCAKKHYR